MSDRTYEAIAVWSQIVAAILFVIALVIIWNRYVAPAVVAGQARKNAELLETEKRRDDARAAVENAQAEGVAADGDVRAIGQRAETDATRLHERMIADARAEGERVMLQAEGELERSRAAARESVRAELVEKAIAIARAGASGLDEATDRRLVGDTVDAADRGGAA